MNNSINYSTQILDLSNQSLKKIPDNIIRYTNLKELNISNNQITELPESLVELKHLEKLTINNNQISSIPDFFRSFKDLKELNISYNPITSLPFNLWKLIGLTYIDISGLHLNNLPVEIGNLRNLEILKINELNLKSLPESIGYLKFLKEFYVENNKLEKLPKTFTLLKSLKKVSYKKNNLKVIPKILFRFKDIEYIDVSDNSINVIPKEIRNFKKLFYLNISKNKISTIPVSIYKLKELKRENFHFKDNHFSKSTLKAIAKKIPSLKTKAKGEKRKKSTPFKVYDFEKDYKTSRFFRIYIPLATLFLIAFLFFLINYSDKKVEVKAQQNLLINKKQDYIIAKEKLNRSIEKVLHKTEKVYVYTNDLSYLKLTLYPNAKFNTSSFKYGFDTVKKTKYINKFLNNKHYGYSVKINNGIRTFKQMWLHDSVIPSRYVKKFRVTRCYRMTDEEIIYNKDRDKKRIIYGKTPQKDEIFAVNRGLVDFSELKRKQFSKETRAIFTPTAIDITRKENYFYFTSLNGNVSKKEFLEAVTYFNEMFISKGNPNKLCVIKKLYVSRE